MSDVVEQAVMGLVERYDRPNDKDYISQHAQAGLFGAFFSLAGSAAMEFFFSDEEFDTSKMVKMGVDAAASGVLGYVGSRVISNENSTLYESAKIGLGAATVIKNARGAYESKKSNKSIKDSNLIEEKSTISNLVHGTAAMYTAKATKDIIAKYTAEHAEVSEEFAAKNIPVPEMDE